MLVLSGPAVGVTVLSKKYRCVCVCVPLVRAGRPRDLYRYIKCLRVMARSRWKVVLYGGFLGYLRD